MSARPQAGRPSSAATDAGSTAGAPPHPARMRRKNPRTSSQAIGNATRSGRNPTPVRAVDRTHRNVDDPHRAAPSFASKSFG